MIKAILISLLHGVLAVLIFILLSYLNINDMQVAGWVIFVISLLGVLIVSLLEAYLFYGIRKVKFFKVINFKTIFTLLIGNLIDIVLCIGIILLCTLIPNSFSRVFVIIPFIELTVCVLALNADAYVAKLAGINKIDEKIDKEVNKQLAKKEE